MKHRHSTVNSLHLPLRIKPDMAASGHDCNRPLEPAQGPVSNCVIFFGPGQQTISSRCEKRPSGRLGAMISATLPGAAATRVPGVRPPKIYLRQFRAGRPKKGCRTARLFFIGTGARPRNPASTLLLFSRLNHAPRPVETPAPRF
jgi:hypothetical protein